jgi:hypothetical protein
VVFAIAMARVETACVYSLRVMVDRVAPYQADPLPMRGGLADHLLKLERCGMVDALW